MTNKPKLQSVYLDVETTGLWANNGDEILEIAIVQSDGQVLLDTFVRPALKASWPQAMAVNHITPIMVKDAPALLDIAGQISRILKGRKVYAWNAVFDGAFLDNLLNDSTLVCAMHEYGRYVKEQHSYAVSSTGRYKLEHAAFDLSVPIQGQAHRALTDVITMMSVRKAWQSGDFDTANLYRNTPAPTYEVKGSHIA